MVLKGKYLAIIIVASVGVGFIGGIMAIQTPKDTGSGGVDAMKAMAVEKDKIIGKLEEELSLVNEESSWQEEYIHDLDSAYEVDTKQKIRYVRQTARIRPSDRRDSIRIEVARHDTISW